MMDKQRSELKLISDYFARIVVKLGEPLPEKQTYKLGISQIFKMFFSKYVNGPVFLRKLCERSWMWQVNLINSKMKDTLLKNNLSFQTLFNIQRNIMLNKHKFRRVNWPTKDRFARSGKQDVTILRNQTYEDLYHQATNKNQILFEKLADAEIASEQQKFEITELQFQLKKLASVQSQADQSDAQGSQREVSMKTSYQQNQLDMMKQICQTYQDQVNQLKSQQTQLRDIIQDLQEADQSTLISGWSQFNQKRFPGFNC